MMPKTKPSLLRDLVARNFGFSSETGRLQIGKIDVGRIVESYGTPVFIYDANIIRNRVETARKTLGSRFDLFYSIKANPCDRILRLMLQLGCGLEVASGGELIRALHAGCRPERIIFAGPGKSPEEIELALSRGIGELHAESQLELKRIAEISRALNKTASVALRINPKSEAVGGAMRMGGSSAPFGIDEERMEAIVEYVLAHPELRLTGLHLFVGTQILDARILVKQYRKLADLSERLFGLTGVPVQTLDFGGGWGVPYFAGDSPLDLTQLRQDMELLVEKHLQTEATRSAQCILEPGRFLVAEAGLYVCSVNDIKDSRGVTYLITNGGMHHHLAASGNLGQTIKRNFPVGLVNRLADAAASTANIVGPLCTPLDTLARKLEIPKPQIGDLVGVFQSGAYAMTASPLGFLSHPPPAEVLVDGEEVLLATRRGAWTDCTVEPASPPQ